MSEINQRTGLLVLQQSHDALLERCEALEMEVRDLRKALGIDLVPILVGLTPTMRDMLGILLKREHASQDALAVCLRGSSNLETVKVHICRIRKWLKLNFGVRLYTRYKQGWFIDPAGKKHVLDYINGLRQEPTHEPPQQPARDQARDQVQVPSGSV